MKKILVISLAAIIALLAVLAGCAGQAASSSSPASQPAGTTSKAASAETTTNSTTGEKPTITVTVYDRGGRVAPSEGTLEDNRWTEWINENGPALVEYIAIPRGESTEVLNTLFASDSAPDLIYEYDTQFKHTLYQQHQLMALDEPIAEYSTYYKSFMAEYPIVKKAGTYDDGQLYVVGRLQEVVPLMSIVIRQDWLDNLGLDMPQTTEDLLNVARAFTKDDPDENGADDTLGIAFAGKGDLVIDQIFQNTGWIEKDGKLVYAWENLEEATRFKKQLYDEGLVDPNFLSSPILPSDVFKEGKLGILPSLFNWNTWAISGLPELLGNDPVAVINPVPLPESGAGRFNPRVENPVQMNGIVNAKAKNVQAVIEFIDFNSNPEYTYTLAYGFAGVHHELNDRGCPVAIDAEKLSREVSSYAREYLMLESRNLDKQCGLMESLFNINDEVEAEALRGYKLAQQAYLDTARPLADFTHPEHMPTLAKEEALIQSTLFKQIDDLMMKAIISGESFTVDQAIEEAQSLWQRGGGDKLEAWYQNWFENESSNTILADDIYEILKKQ